MMEPKLFETETACKLLGFRRTMLFQKLASGELTRVKCGRKTLVTAESIDAFIASNTIKR